MKRIGITQRVDLVESYGERRDCLDQRWYDLVFELGGLPIPLPNIDVRHASKLIGSLNLDAILLTGGNSLTFLDPEANDIAPERDAFEAELVKFALAHYLPIFGVCRGMQFINNYFGGQLSPIQEHVAVKHEIHGQLSYSVPTSVNSFHSWGISKSGLAKPLSAIALDNNGFVEAFCLEEQNILGLMWHPERDKPFDDYNIKLMRQFIND